MNWSKTNFVHKKCVIKLDQGRGRPGFKCYYYGEGIISQGFFVDVDDAMLFGGVNATQFRFFMKWEIIFFERVLFHFRKIWKIMPLKSTIFLSGRKYIYHGTHLVVIFFVFVVIMNSTLIQIKEKNSGKKFITIIYRVMI